MADKAQNKPPLLVLLGPTAVGKTAFSVELAAALNAEIISGDSMQFYRYMDIGTAKIRPAEMLSAFGRLIPHHLIDILDPDQPMSAADFQTAAAAKISEIVKRGRLPMLVGGTGLYLRALISGYKLDEAAPADEELRARLRGEYQTLGKDALHRRLQEIDPAAAARISPNDEKRLLRALEVFELSGRPISAQGRAQEAPYNVLSVGLIRDRAELYRRIEARVDIMLQDGLLTEVERLLAMGYSAECKPMQGLGYRQMCRYIGGEIDLSAAVELIKRDTRRFAKRQLTWWRRDDKIFWYPADMPLPERLAAVCALARAQFGQVC